MGKEGCQQKSPCCQYILKLEKTAVGANRLLPSPAFRSLYHTSVPLGKALSSEQAMEIHSITTESASAARLMESGIFSAGMSSHGITFLDEVELRWSI